MTVDDLRSALATLRYSWPDRWPGLPAVLLHCLAGLKHNQGCHPEPSRYRSLKEACLGMAEQVEMAHAAMAADSLEAAYHNRLHFGDTLWCMATLLAASRDRSDQSPQQADKDPGYTSMQRESQEMLAMLVMVTHDFRHDGRINQHPMEMESRSAMLAEPMLVTHGLSPDDVALIKRLIQYTDPSKVAGNHREVIGLPFSLDEARWLQVIVNEADILASTLPDFGDLLGQSLSLEWSKVNQAMAQSVGTRSGRLYFLEKLAIFSSPGSHRLGLDQLRNEQIMSLRMENASA
ncbi:MAG: hypothetical protein EBZ03_07450 [Betaproteobacteria bacterium]|nr:hypothetical protein [Betaproteobacteria bacterium]NBQ09968.1 hypothetical protein [Betaproteobacteria bacterium]NBT65079.1 hypothetical protein [Betaproteobacteria bacterium]NBU00995.1 hypothetical protein [Betaproteobacteria bacterium]NBU66255.1 hypothetical protein [Betaproteobacteria bacterium]